MSPASTNGSRESSRARPDGAAEARLVGLALAGLSGSARAEDYPTRAVTIVVPFTPGGSTDTVARMLGQKLEQRLGESFVVEGLRDFVRSETVRWGRIVEQAGIARSE
jgi:hypothetical protein